jgi:photosystem II stability/assembly factor-like uncharacterized protein
MRSIRTWALAALLIATASPAAANGRFPESLRLLEDPRTPDRLYLAGTFGLLVTEDRGKNWQYICEKAFAFAFVEGDPLLEVTNDGTLLSGIFDSVNASRDCGCTWQYSLGESKTEDILDIALDPSMPGTVVALTQKNDVFPYTADLRETNDSGKTWRKIGDVPATNIGAYTLDLAPSDPKRIYVTGLDRARDASLERGVLYVSKDRGAAWETRDIPGTGNAAQPYIAGVHPTVADTVYVRTDEWIDNAEPSANDRLLLTTDAGQTWRELIRKGGKLFGFALSPDGGTVLVGYGDPMQAGGRSTEPADLGIYRASTQDYVFERVFTGMVSCLRWTPTGLYVCNTEFNPDAIPNDFELGFAKNADFTLATQNPFTVLLSLKDVRGPSACHSADCNEIWSKSMPGMPAVCEQFRASCTVPAAPARLSCGSGGAGGGALGDSGMTGGAGGTSGASTGGSGGAADDDGCGCRLPGQRSSSLAPLAILATSALLAHRCRRARKARRS